MTEPIELTEEDIQIFNDFGKDDDGHDGSNLLIHTKIIPIEEVKQLKQQILENQRLREELEAEQKCTLVFGTPESVNQMHWKQEFIKRLLDKAKGD